MDNIDRLYAIWRILSKAQRFEDGGIYLSPQDLERINRHLRSLYDTLVRGDAEGENEGEEDD